MYKIAETSTHGNRMQKFEERELVEIVHQGSKIFGVLHLPVGQKKCPVVLFCHGLAGHKIGKHRMYVLLAECLSRVGIASFRFDFRGSGDSEGDFSEMSLEGEVADTLKAFEFLTGKPNLDASRMGVFGRSFGASIAVLATQYFRKVKTMALWAPVYDAKQWEEQWEMFETHQIDEKARHELMRINGQLPSISFYKELFAMNIEKAISMLNHVPLLLIHGESDPLVSIEHSIRYVEKRKEADAPTEFIKMRYSDHDFTHPEEKLQAIDLTCKWFAQTL